MPTTLSREESKELARNIVDALVLKLSDEQVVLALSAVWGRQLDQWIGRGFRRFAMYVIFAALVAGAIKFQIWNSMLK